jgi:hypothetical protein
MGLVYQSSGVATFSGADIGHDYVLAGDNVVVGDLLILGVNVHNGTVSTPSGFTTASSDTSTPQSVYVFFKIAAGGEETVTITTNADRNVALSYLRYSGANASPLDVTDIGHDSSMVQESPAVVSDMLFGFDELALLFAFNNNSTSTDILLTPSWPVGYTTHLNTGPGVDGYGLDTTVQHLVAARTDASGIETPQITWVGGDFVNRTSVFVAFSTVETHKYEAGTASLGFNALAEISKRSNFAGSATIGITTTARISKTISVAMSTRIIAIMDAILSAVEAALVATLGGAIARPVLAPSAALVGVDDQLSVNVDRTFRVNSAIFVPDMTDTAATAAYLVVVLNVSVLRTLSGEDELTAATAIAVADALAVRISTEAALTGLSDVDGFQMGVQNYTRAGSALSVAVRLEI